MFLKWTRGNEKLNKLATIGFGLPAFESADGFRVCPMAGACASICYARQGQYQFGVVKAAREFNLAIVRTSIADFKARAMSNLRHTRAKTIRVHDSGDFFSQEYLDAWYAIARAFPERRFYAYTKSLHLDLWSKKPRNFSIVQSEGGQLDKAISKRRPHSRIFATDAARRRAGYGQGSKTDSLAIRGARRIGLVYHGSKNLTPAQEEHFS